jgi:hypothetical protein
MLKWFKLLIIKDIGTKISIDTTCYERKDSDNKTGKIIKLVKGGIIGLQNHISRSFMILIL